MVAQEIVGDDECALALGCEVDCAVHPKGVVVHPPRRHFQCLPVPPAPHDPLVVGVSAPLVVRHALAMLAEEHHGLVPLDQLSEGLVSLAEAEGAAVVIKPAIRSIDHDLHALFPIPEPLLEARELASDLHLVLWLAECDLMVDDLCEKTPNLLRCQLEARQGRYRCALRVYTQRPHQAGDEVLRDFDTGPLRAPLPQCGQQLLPCDCHIAFDFREHGPAFLPQPGLARAERHEGSVFVRAQLAP
mmetsp:Transcript_7857/g.15167  ORF Transcript_7857/g.15167 Transcript_7857/m.15167 type:complete len:245 (-) Transcript_7857:1-735(-)